MKNTTREFLSHDGPNGVAYLPEGWGGIEICWHGQTIKLSAAETDDLIRKLEVARGDQHRARARRPRFDTEPF